MSTRASCLALESPASRTDTCFMQFTVLWDILITFFQGMNNAPPYSSQSKTRPQLGEMLRNFLLCCGDLPNSAVCGGRHPSSRSRGASVPRRMGPALQQRKKYPSRASWGGNCRGARPACNTWPFQNLDQVSGPGYRILV